MDGQEKTSQDKTSNVRAVLEPVTSGLERLEQAAIDAAPEMEEVKSFARKHSLLGARLGLMAALTVASPKDMIKRALGYVDEAEAAMNEENDSASAGFAEGQSESSRDDA